MAAGVAIPTEATRASRCRAATRSSYFGDYEMLEELGRGGMGVVYKARQVSLNRPVALKMIRLGRPGRPTTARRFQNEAEAVARLDHPAHRADLRGRRARRPPLLQHEADRRATASTDGSTITSPTPRPRPSWWRRRRGDAPRPPARHPAPRPEAGQYPARRRGQPHVTDFGLAKRVEGDSELTQTGAIVGTPAYMAPEQAEGTRGRSTTATDVYGLGAILYALLTGRPPFGGDSLLDTLEQVREPTAGAPRELNPALPRDLETICLKCLEKDPRRAIRSAAGPGRGPRRPGGRADPATARGPERAWIWCRRPLAAGAMAPARRWPCRDLDGLRGRKTRAKNRITGLALDLRSSLDQSQRLGGELRTSLKESYTRLARLDFERAELFEKSRPAPACSGWSRAGREIAADDPGWQTVAAGPVWQRQHVGPKMVLFHDGHVRRMALSPDGKTILTGSGTRRPGSGTRRRAGRSGPPMPHRGPSCRGVQPRRQGRPHRQLTDGAALGRDDRPPIGSPDGTSRGVSLPWRSAPTARPSSPGATTRRRGSGTRRPARPIGSPMAHQAGQCRGVQPRRQDGRSPGARTTRRGSGTRRPARPSAASWCIRHGQCAWRSAPTARPSSPAATTRRRGSGTRRPAGLRRAAWSIRRRSWPWRSAPTARPSSLGVRTRRRDSGTPRPAGRSARR